MRNKTAQRQSFAARGDQKKKKTKKLKEIEQENDVIHEEESDAETEKTPKKIAVQEKISNQDNTVRPISPGKIGALEDPEKAPAGNRGENGKRYSKTKEII